MASARDPVLLLHGQPGRARDWERVRDALGEGTTTIAPDRPGWDGGGPAADVQGNVRAALAALDGAGAERAIVVGHSFGAAVAAWLAAEHPQRVKGLVLIAPAANLASLYRLDYVLAAPVGGYVASAALLGGAGLALSSGLLRRRVAQALALDERYLRRAAALLGAPSAWRAFVTEQRSLVRDLPTLEERLGRLTASTVVLAGGADRVVPLWSARRLVQQIPAAELVVLDDANHLIPQQHPHRVAAAISAVGD